MSQIKSNQPKISYKIPEPSLRRLPWYLSCLKLSHDDGAKFVSSTQMSKDTGIDASQIAKDMSYLNISGRTRVGYEVESLINVLEDFLGFSEQHNACLFGAGSLGRALLGDSGLSIFGLKIVAAFDIDPQVVGTTVGGIPVYHFDELEERLEKCNAKIGVLTVPVSKAQGVADTIVDAGLKAIWNFTPFRIQVPQDIVVQNTSLYAHLAVMFNRLKANEEGEN